MADKVIIVESPSKTKTIQSYVDNNTIVLSSKGHIRDLATSGKDGLGIDIDNNFQPQYIVIKKQKELVKSLIKQTKGKNVYIATDPDREGEAIGWHLIQSLNLDITKPNRIIFREITKRAVLEALEKPRQIDQNLVNSQEARRILDRIIGFKLSSLLQNKIKSKSAGRVQSVALKMIVDLEKEIESFIPETYYEIEAIFKDFKAQYIIKDKTRLTKEEAELIVSESKNPFIVSSIDSRESKRQSKPPFITSTLQQEAIQSLNMSASKTMMVAQKLYEGIKINDEIVGLITYMRTDSTRLSDIFVNDAQNYIENRFGKSYLGRYQQSKNNNSQDAHEAIRPTNLKLTPEYVEEFLSKEEFKLYKRIYERTIASLMAPAIFKVTKVILKTNNHEYLLEGLALLFDGHLKMFNDKSNQEKRIPNLTIDEKLNSEEIMLYERVTKPKTRYSEATLIKALEQEGIGRPSTYASILQTLKKRDYVQTVEKRFIPTEQGRLTTEQLELFFSKIVDIGYTSRMEKALDMVALGEESGVTLVSKFYHSFMPLIEKAKKEMQKIKPKETDEFCPLCGKVLVIKQSKYGEFVACSGFPQCKYIKKEKKPEKLTKKP